MRQINHSVALCDATAHHFAVTCLEGQWTLLDCDQCGTFFFDGIFLLFIVRKMMKNTAVYVYRRRNLDSTYLSITFIFGKKYKLLMTDFIWKPSSHATFKSSSDEYRNFVWVRFLGQLEFIQIRQLCGLSWFFWNLPLILGWHN